MGDAIEAKIKRWERYIEECRREQRSDASTRSSSMARIGGRVVVGRGGDQGSIVAAERKNYTAGIKWTSRVMVATTPKAASAAKTRPQKLGGRALPDRCRSLPAAGLILGFGSGRPPSRAPGANGGERVTFRSPGPSVMAPPETAACQAPAELWSWAKGRRRPGYLPTPSPRAWRASPCAPERPRQERYRATDDARRHPRERPQRGCWGWSLADLFRRSKSIRTARMSARLAHMSAQ